MLSLMMMSDDVNVIQELIAPPCTCDYVQSRHTESTDKLSKLANKKNRRQTKYYDLLIAAFVGLKSQKSTDSKHMGTQTTRKLSYRKADRAMLPIYGCPENFQESLTTPTNF